MNAKKILVIEDDRVTQKLIADALSSAGYEVATANDGASAVTMARKLEPDLITLDVQLAKSSPDDSWDGFTVVAWLRRMSEGQRVPVLVVVSGLEPADIIEKAAAVGAYTFLPKPFEKKKLLEAVARALESRAGPAKGQA
jgi:CheY-like chemotaxis protein